MEKGGMWCFAPVLFAWWRETGVGYARPEVVVVVDARGSENHVLVYFCRGADVGGVELVGVRLLIVARLLLGTNPVLCLFDVVGRSARCSVIEFSPPGGLGSTERARVVRPSPMVLSVLS